MDELLTLGATVGILGAIFIGGCVPHGGHSIETRTNYSPRRSYGPSEGSRYGSRYRVGLPRNPTPRNIQRKFRQDEEYMRRTRRGR